MPYTQSTDLRIAKNFATGKTSYIRATFTIENLFKNLNVNYVYGRTGSPYYDGADLKDTQNQYVFEQTQHIHDMLTKDPSNINKDRNYIFGLSYNF
jgi:hypothetical protein